MIPSVGHFDELLFANLDALFGDQFPAQPLIEASVRIVCQSLRHLRSTTPRRCGHCSSLFSLWKPFDHSSQGLYGRAFGCQSRAA